MNDKLADLMKDELFAKGYEIRRRAFGDEVVAADTDKRMNDEFQQPMWQHGVQAAWGLIWSRPGLDARARSIATLSALVALNVPDEIEKHVRAAVSNGVTEVELRELLLHLSTYCGFPKAAAAFKIASEVMKEPAVKKRAAENAGQKK
ncbi:MAG: 4-carboxymuconolactone decarboxylase [Betaproteobacteria bacterium]|nr:4-carboxymuconolactone decarboxylase [Betaproteobacteria bacterium]